jgi:uncharacterized protein
MQHSQFDDMLQWLTGATLVTAFGLVVVAVIAAAVSYLLTSFGWRWWIARKRRTRIERLRHLRATHPHPGPAE